VTCRRCTECLGEDHHWLPWLPDFDESGDPFVPCKHCDARANLCEDCFEAPASPPAGDRCEDCARAAVAS
jgi:hypothetical protein